MHFRDAFLKEQEARQLLERYLVDWKNEAATRETIIGSTPPHIYRKALQHAECLSLPTPTIWQLLDHLWGLDLVVTLNGSRVGVDVTASWDLIPQKVEKLEKLRSLHHNLDIRRSLVLYWGLSIPYASLTHAQRGKLTAQIRTAARSKKPYLSLLDPLKKDSILVQTQSGVQWARNFGGIRKGRLTGLRYHNSTPGRRGATWNWRCDCGREVSLPVASVTSGRTIECPTCEHSRLFETLEREILNGLVVGW